MDTRLRAQEVLQLSLCLLRGLQGGPCDTVLKYKCTIMCTLLYKSKWHHDLHGQALSEEFGEGIVRRLVRDKAKNTGSVTAEQVENHYLLLKVGPGFWNFFWNFWDELCASPRRKILRRGPQSENQRWSRATSHTAHLQASTNKAKKRDRFWSNTRPSSV